VPVLSMRLPLLSHNRTMKKVRTLYSSLMRGGGNETLTVIERMFRFKITNNWGIITHAALNLIYKVVQI
jgi:hypothetical protein